MPQLTIEEMRWKLYKCYPGTDWQADVACFSDDEVKASYFRHLRDGKIQRGEEAAAIARKTHPIMRPIN